MSMTTQTPDAVRDALRAQHDWHYEKAKALSKQPQTADVQWRRDEHREQIDAIAFALSALDSRAGDAGEDGGKALFEHEMRQRGVQGLWADLDEDERKGWRESARVVLSATPAPAVDAQEAGRPCDTCQGNGEVVTDWDRYMHGKPGDTGDEGTEDCPDCDGTGRVEDAPAVDAVPAGEVERLARIRTSMALLQQNSEGCALNHYGNDATLHGMPGWLIDTKADLNALTDLLAKWEANHG